MGCTNCGSVGCSVDGGVSGCNSNGGCATGGCNRMNTYDWLSDVALPTFEDYHIVEVSFKNGSRKGFYINPVNTQAITGDMVVVEADNGADVGKISLSGELVRLQMKKKRVNPESYMGSVIRKANHRDIERLKEARALERSTMVKARVISRSLGLNMKIGDVEYQGDRRKATFYYTAEGRVDFRELIKLFAKEFRVKIEMRQIGARQESARIGGIGSCGRELCCSTWLSDFKSVSTAAARYQNLAINQVKLSGQCGRLKCCLNYELDSYMDALEAFPKRADKLHTEAGSATLIKTDIFKQLMYYIYEGKSGFKKVHALHVSRVKEILALNKAGKKPLDLKALDILEQSEEIDLDFADVTGEIQLANDPKKKRRRRNRGNRNKNNSPSNKNNTSGTDKPKAKKTANQQQSTNKEEGNNNKRQPRSKNRKPNNQRKNTNDNKNTAKNSQKNQSKNTNTSNKKGDNKPADDQKPTRKKSPFRRRNKNRNRNRNNKNNNKDNNNNEDNKE